MRKTSQDGGDSTSITSGLGIMKSTRNSIKRKVQSLSHESDDGVIEPLLQKDKENSIPLAKFSISKPKTDQTSDKGKDNQAFKVNLTDIKPSTTAAGSTKDTKVSDAGGVDHYRSAYSTVVPYRTYVPSVLEPVKEQVLVSIEGSKTGERANSPLIFTTAKIHADTKSNQTEQVRVTPSSLSKTDSIDSKQTVNLHNNDKTHNIENGKAINNYQDTNELGGPVSVHIKESIQTPVTKYNVVLETKGLDINSTKSTGLPTSTAKTLASSVRDSVNTIKTTNAEPTIKIESISDSKLENNKVQVNAKCVALENVSVEIKKTENKIGHSVNRNDIDGIDINKNIQSKAIASMAGSLKSFEGTSTTKAFNADKKYDKPLQRQKTSSIEGNDSTKAKSPISSGSTAGSFGKSEDSKSSFKLPSLNKKSFDDKASTKPATSVTKSNDTKPTIASSVTTRSSTKTINVSAVSKTTLSSSVKPLSAPPKSVTTTANSSTSASMAKSPKVSTVSTIHNVGQSGTQCKVGNKESSNKPTDLKLNTEKERENIMVTRKT